jgi:hypothetical protein
MLLSWYNVSWAENGTVALLLLGCNSYSHPEWSFISLLFISLEVIRGCYWSGLKVDLPVLHHHQRWDTASSSCNSQSDITSEEHLKTLLRFLSKTHFKITSLFHLHEYTLYQLLGSNCISDSIQEGHRRFWWSCIIRQCVGCKPHIASIPGLGSLSEYWVQRALVLHDSAVALQRLSRQATFDGWDRVVSSY